MLVTANTSQEPGQPTSETIPYVVQEGDTLWLIADRAYNSGTLWQVIFEENRDTLDSADQIQPGQVLRIPLSP
jgi:nucleoid-associated protein YgaU